MAADGYDLEYLARIGLDVLRVPNISARLAGISTARQERLHPGSPLDTKTYTVPIMSREEAERITVPFAEVKERLRHVVNEYGCAVVSGVIPSRHEVNQLEAIFKGDLEDVVDSHALQSAPASVQEAHLRFGRGGPRAFPLKTAKVLTQGNGFMLRRGMPHSRFAWTVRRHPNVHKVYRTLYPESHQLVTSLDATFFSPGGQPAVSSCGFAAHVDQNAHDVRTGLSECDLSTCQSFQGVLHVWPSGAEEPCATTVVWPKSHRTVWPRMMKDEQFMRNGTKGYHYSEVSQMQDVGLARELADQWQRHARRCVVPAGALLLWNSRTVHAGWLGGPRLAQAVCLEPAERRCEAARLGKLRLAALGLPSVHWASVAMQHDMTRYEKGYFRAGGVPAEAAEELDDVVLPLRPAIRPACLASTANMERLRELVKVNFELTCIWAPPADKKPLLVESIDRDYQQYI